MSLLFFLIPHFTRSHFGSSHFCSNLRCSRVEVGCGVLFLLHSVRRRTMPRRGWLPAPDGWVQIIRGPRLPSMKWPSATEMRHSSNTVKKHGDGGVQRPQARGRWRQPPARVSRGVSRSSAETCCRARRGVESVWGRYRARGDDSSRVSEVCETCSAGPTSHRAGLSVRAVHCTGAETVGRTRRGANSVGQAVGGWSAAPTQPPRASFQVGRTSSPATRLGSPGCEPPTNGERLAIRAGRSGGADPCREDRFVATSREPVKGRTFLQCRL